MLVSRVVCSLREALQDLSESDPSAAVRPEILAEVVRMDAAGLQAILTDLQHHGLITFSVDGLVYLEPAGIFAGGR